MTEERKQELKQLLQAATAPENLEIRPRSANMFTVPSMDVHTYKACLREHWTSYSLDSLSVMNYVPHISKTIKLTLLDFIRKEFTPFIREDRILSASSYFLLAGSKNGYPLTNLLVRLLKIAIVRGVEEAVLAFDRGTKDTHGSAQSFALLEGIKIKTETPIFEGIRLVCLPNSTSELPPYSRNLYIHPSDTSAGSFLGKTLLIIDYSVFPIFYRPFEFTTIQEYRKLLNRTFRVEINGDKSADSYVADFSEESFCQALSLACNSSVQIARKWWFSAEDEIFRPFPGGSMQYSPRLFGDSIKAEQSEIEEAKCLYEILVDLDSDIKGILEIAIDRWIKSKANKDAVNKMIDLGIALESFYLPKDNIDQLAFQFRLRASWHLGKDKEDRKKLIDEFKAIYSLRSKAVHNGELPPKVNIKKGEEPIATSEFITRAQNLCLKSIKNILKKGEFPDWNNLILGEESS